MGMKMLENGSGILNGYAVSCGDTRGWEGDVFIYVNVWGCS